MSEVLLFDIDGTMWDPNGRNQSFLDRLARQWGVSQEEYHGWLDQYVADLPDSSFFNPNDWLSFLHGKLYETGHPVEEEELASLFYERRQFLDALYPEVLSVLEGLSKSYVLGCFSQGFVEFQLIKLQLTGIYPLLARDRLYISNNKTAPEYLELLPESVIIDDRPDMIARLRDYPHLKPVWLRRPDSKYAAVEAASSEYLAGIPVIATLEELPEVL